MNIKIFDFQTNFFFNNVKKQLNRKVKTINGSVLDLMRTSLRDTLFSDRRTRKASKQVKNFKGKVNKFLPILVGSGSRIDFTKRKREIKSSLTLVKNSISSETFWTLMVAKHGRRALTQKDLKRGNNFFGVRLRESDVRSSSLRAAIPKLKQNGFTENGKIIFPMQSVGPVMPYFDWVESGNKNIKNNFIRLVNRINKK